LIPLGVACGLAVPIIGVRAQLVDRPVQHLAYLGWQRDAHLRYVDVEYSVKIGIELQCSTSQLSVLVDAPDAVPAAPLHQSFGAVDVDALLPVPVKRPGVALKFLV
jgi:hypothetical protein